VAICSPLRKQFKPAPAPESSDVQKLAEVVQGLKQQVQHLAAGEDGRRVTPGSGTVWRPSACNCRAVGVKLYHYLTPTALAHTLLPSYATVYQRSEALSTPDKTADIRIEIKVHRNSETGMCKGEADAHWDAAGSEHCTCIDENGGPIYSTRAEAAAAMNELVGKWIAENA
jgi:hypothetical protein